MKIVKVQYTTTAGFAVINQQNIKGIVEELKHIGHPGIIYGTYLLPDGKTFMHLDHFVNEEAHQVLANLKSFKKFATELDESQLEVEPVLELLSSVASSIELFVTKL